MYNPQIDDFFFLKLKKMWRYFKGQHFSFWMISIYLFFEYTRPQAIFPIIDFLPWAQLFLIGALIGAILDKSVKWVSSPINLLMILFGFLIFLSSVNAYYPDISKDHYIDFYSWFVVYFLIINIVNTKQRFYVFLIIFIVCAAKISIGTSKAWALRGFSFTSWGLSGPKGYFQNSGELAILMLTLFPVAYYLYDFLKNRVGKFEWFILQLFWITPILTVLGASSRGAQLALVGQLLIMFRKSVFRVKPLIGIIIIFSFIYLIIPDDQKQRFEAAGEDKTSQQRLLYWQHGWEMMKEHPVLGVGYFNFPKYYSENYPEDMLYPRAELPHNIFIQVGTDAGFLGLITFLFIIFSPYLITRKIINDKDDYPFLSRALLGVLYGNFGFIMAGQFVTVAYYPFLWIGLAFIVSIVNIYTNDKDNYKVSRNLRMKKK